MKAISLPTFYCHGLYRLYQEPADNIGRLVKKQSADYTGNTFQIQLNLDGFASGMYQLQIKQTGWMVEKKVVMGR